jgi:hypothetical protein
VLEGFDTDGIVLGQGGELRITMEAQEHEAEAIRRLCGVGGLYRRVHAPGAGPVAFCGPAARRLEAWLQLGLCSGSAPGGSCSGMMPGAAALPTPVGTCATCPRRSRRRARCATRSTQQCARSWPTTRACWRSCTAWRRRRSPHQVGGGGGGAAPAGPVASCAWWTPLPAPQAPLHPALDSWSGHRPRPQPFCCPAPPDPCPCCRGPLWRRAAGPAHAGGAAAPFGGQDGRAVRGHDLLGR